MKAGEALRGKIASRGIDLRVTLFSPTGECLLDLEAPGSGLLPPEPLLAVAEVNGGYRLELGSSRAGIYALSLETSRRATLTDRRRALAAIHLSRGLASRREPSAKAHRHTIRELERAFDLWDAATEPRERALTLLWLGSSYENLGEHQKARNLFEQALPLFLAAGDRAGEALLVDAIGRSRYHLGDLEQALGAYLRSLSLYQQLGDGPGEADTLSNIALVYKRRGRVQDALAFYHRSLALWRKLGGRGNQAIILSNIGQVDLAMGRPSEALRSFQEALLLQHGVERALAREAVTLSSIGAAYLELGKVPEALDNLSRALELTQRLGEAQNETSTLSWMGHLLLEAGQIDQAKAYLEKALKVARRIDDIRGKAYALGNLARICDLENRETEAVRLFDEARKLAQAAGDADSEARILDGAARAWRDLGDLPTARNLASEGLDLTESLRTGTTSQDLRSSFAAQVRERYLFYIDLLIRSHRREPGKGLDVQAFEVSERARARSLLDELAESQADLRTGVDPNLIEAETRLLREIKKRERALQIWPSRPQDEESLRRLAALERELSDLVVQHDHLQAEIRAASPRYAALVQSSPLTLQEVRREVLDGDSLLLSYVLAEPRSFLFLVGRDSLEVFDLPERRTIEAAVLDLGQFLVRNRRRAAQGEFAAAARRLSDLLLAPVSGRLEAKRLLIVADGALHLVPFAALPELGGEAGVPARPLVAGHEIVHLPSASALALLRRDRALRRPAPHAVAVLADPVFGPADSRLAAALGTSSRAAIEEDFQDLPPLYWSRAEAEAILSFVPAGESFRALGFDANLETAKSPLLGQYRIVHFATHGKLDPHPELSGIVLSQFDEQGNRREGFLHALEIYGLDLPVELVVLSACETALGEDVRGEGVSRLTRGFLYAGAKGVVVSLWSVSDRATAELMTHFYSAMLREGLSPAAALRKAQMAVRSHPGWEAPYYWAGFVLQGDWK